MICHYAKEKLTNVDIMVEQSDLHSKGIGGGDKGGQDFYAAKDSIMNDSFFMQPKHDNTTLGFASPNQHIKSPINTAENVKQQVMNFTDRTYQ
jgi:hypothetical protein